MPNESTTPVWTTQTSQNTQTTANQSWNDFMLDFWDLGNETQVADIEVDSSLKEEEKTDNELGFDIDLWWDNQSSVEEVVDEPKSEVSVAKDVSVEAQEETISDFDFSMDYEWNSEEDNSEKEENISESEKNITEEDEIIPDEELSFDNKEETAEDEKMASEPEEKTIEEDEIIPDEELSFETGVQTAESEEIIPDEEPVSNEEEIMPDEELSFVKDEDNESEDKGTRDQAEEWWHLFHQINEDDQNEISFDLNQPNDDNKTFQSEENSENKTLFMSANDATITNESEANYLSELSDNPEKLTELDMEVPEQKQPELGDLLSNSLIDLSKELNDIPENSESNLMSEDVPVDSTEAWSQDVLEDDSILDLDSEEITFESNQEESDSEPVLENIVPEATLEPNSQELESEPVVSVESNEFLLDIPQVEPNTQNIQGNSQQKTVENTEVTQAEAQTQTDTTIDMINNTISQINEQNVEVPEINISTPVELSDMSSSQRESNPTETDGQIQSTLSLDQILDSELLSNPQYADNSKAAPQNLLASWWRSKAWMLIGVGVTVLGCCVAFLAFPSITTLIKPVNTVSTWTVVECPTTDGSHCSAPDEPTGWEDSIGWQDLTGQDSTAIDNSQLPDKDLLENLGNSWENGWVMAVSIIDDGNDSWDWEVGTEPVPYVWTDDWQSDDIEIQEPVVEEIDANQILEVISSFKSQGERYYSYGGQQADTQLMKYAQRLVALCDNYRDKVNNWEWTDSENLASFKTTANNILNKIGTYLGGDEEVQVIRDATIDGESYFEWKDELKEYLYNNR